MRYLPRGITIGRWPTGSLHDIPDDWGTAVNVQAMVFGNRGEDSGTGVVFTRDPSTGEKYLYGEFLQNAQGEDVVAGIRDPQHITALRGLMPDVYAELVTVCQRLEHHFRDMQDIEFTVQEGTLYLLQTRTGKRTAPAAVRIAVEMVQEGFIDQRQAVMRVEPEQIDQLLHPMIDPQAEMHVLGRGLPASPGAASGRVVFTAEEAVRRQESGGRVLLSAMRLAGRHPWYARGTGYFNGAWGDDVTCGGRGPWYGEELCRRLSRPGDQRKLGLLPHWRPGDSGERVLDPRRLYR